MDLLKKVFVFLVVTGLIAFSFAPALLAEETSAVSASISSGSDNEFTVKKFVGLAVGFGIAIAAFGGALGQGRAASAALEGIARNPGASDKLFTPMILALALIESLVIYSLVISFTLVGKL